MISYKNFEKIVLGFLLFLLLVISIITTLDVISAKFERDDYDLKWSFCAMLNKTGLLCDEWWEDNSEYPESLTNNASLEHYYNKSEVDKICNGTNMTYYLSGQNVTDVNRSYVDDKFLSLRNQLESDIDDLKYDRRYIDDVSPSTRDIDPIWLVVGIAGIGAFMWWTNKSKQEVTPVQRGEAPTFHRKIQSRPDLEKEEEIRKLKEREKELLEKLKEDN